ncbi:MAG: hypothetical protein MJY84_05270 [Bacteroidales bacterium]|nr:hypothetical protein [Bacteroidales bacterium]
MRRGLLLAGIALPILFCCGEYASAGTAGSGIVQVKKVQDGRKTPQGACLGPLTGKPSGPAVTNSPDPLVNYRWKNPCADDELEVFALEPVEVKVASPASASATLKGKTEVRVTYPCDIRLDFGQVNAGWLEFECSDPEAARFMECSISEFNEPAVFNAGSQHPHKTLAPQVDGKTCRLVLNNDLYEGVRYAWIHVLETRGKPLKISNIRLVCQTKPTNYEGSFDSDSDILNRIWYTAAYTVRLNFLKEYFGAILMERSDRFSWTGDAHTSQAASLVAFGNYDFVRKNLLHTADQSNGIRSYPLYWVQSLVDYFNYTGDAELLTMLTDNACKKLDEAFYAFENPKGISFYGWDERLGAGFEEPDSAEPTLAYRMLCIQSWIRFAGAMADIGRKDLADRFKACAVRSAARLYQMPGLLKDIDLFSASDAINAGVLNSGEWNLIWDKVYGDRIQRVSYSPFNEYFVLNALARMGRHAEAMNTIDDCWGGQVRYGATTFFEVFRPSWNLCKEDQNDAPVNNQCGYTSMTHPWSAGVAKWLTEEVLGVKPETPGFAAFTIRPHLTGGLTRVSGTVPTPHGKISFGIDTKSGTASLTVPSGCMAKVGIPMMGTTVKSLTVDGETVEIKCGADQFCELPSLEEGTHEIRFEYSETPCSRVAMEEVSYCYPARTFSEDRQTKGDWKGGYGSKGYALFSYDGPGAHRIKLPDGCRSLIINKARMAEYASSTSDPRALESPEEGGSGRRLGALVTGDPDACWQTMTVDVDYRTAGPYKVSLYFVDWYNDSPSSSVLKRWDPATSSSRRSAIEVFDLDSRRLLAPVHMVRDYSGGVYVTFEADRPVRIRVDQVRGQNASLSALFLD